MYELPNQRINDPIALPPLSNDNNVRGSPHQAPVQVRSCHFSTRTRLPAAFVNSLSRNEALRYYSEAFNDPNEDEPYISFNWDMDTAMCVCETFGIGGYYERPLKKALAGPQLLKEFDVQTRDNLKFLMLSPEDFDQYMLGDIFPALEELRIICNGRNNLDAQKQAIDYDLVTEYKVFLAYNRHVSRTQQSTVSRALSKISR